MTTTIDLGYLPKQAARNVSKALHNATYMNFQVHLGLAPGGMSVTLITTDYPGTFKEISEMAMHVMAYALKGEVAT